MIYCKQETQNLRRYDYPNGKIVYKQQRTLIGLFVLRAFKHKNYSDRGSYGKGVQCDFFRLIRKNSRV